jgi:hypothetical protein
LRPVKKQLWLGDGIADETGKGFCLSRIENPIGDAGEGGFVVYRDRLESRGKSVGLGDEVLPVAFEEKDRLAGAAGPFQGVEKELERPLFRRKELEDIRFEACRKDREGRRQQEKNRHEKHQERSPCRDPVEPLQVSLGSFMDEGGQTTEERMCHGRLQPPESGEGQHVNALQGRGQDSIVHGLV